MPGDFGGYCTLWWSGVAILMFVDVAYCVTETNPLFHLEPTVRSPRRLGAENQMHFPIRQE